MGSNMYPETETWNPFVGCRYDCNYCEATFQGYSCSRRRKKAFDLLVEFARERGIIGDESGNVESSLDRGRMDENSQRGEQT